MTNAIVLMTALVPTLGHKYLIDFAANLPVDTVHVIVNSLDKEPLHGKVRADAIRKHFFRNEKVIVHLLHRDVPQDPSEHDDFWNLWKDLVLEFVNVQPEDIFVASELYGINMAKVLGCKFMPCNRYRETVPVKGTHVRSDLFTNFDQILPEFQSHLRQTITIFGAESCGKTTVSKRLSKELNGWFLPEWAREYLETVGPEVTDEKMDAIVQGQYAIQMTAKKQLFGKPFIIQDTDLLSTIGYYRLYGGNKRRDMEPVYKLFLETKSDLYVMMNTGIPFEKDPLRYGGDKRESDMDFWINLLEEFDCNYVTVPAFDHEKQTVWIYSRIKQHFTDKFQNLIDFER